MREVVLFIAMSLDGVIATPEGAVDWLGGEDAESSDSGSYERFIAGVSNVVMGYTTYHQLTTELLPGAWPYAAQSTHVLTHRSMRTRRGFRSRRSRLRLCLRGSRRKAAARFGFAAARPS